MGSRNDSEGQVMREIKKQAVKGNTRKLGRRPLARYRKKSLLEEAKRHGQGLTTDGIGVKPQFLLRPENFVRRDIQTGDDTKFVSERMGLKHKRPVCGA